MWTADVRVRAEAVALSSLERRRIGNHMDLHLELFVDDLARSRDFYTRVLGFTVTGQKQDGFTELSQGAATLALNDRTVLKPGHPARPGPNETIAKGVEIVLLVAELDEVYQQVLASGWPLSTPITKQPWGMTDFRLIDPDGCYIRVTARQT
jgi:catechol 2,3-dioxygenase-like lactoylglutathione lyase family enzyme